MCIDLSVVIHVATIRNFLIILSINTEFVFDEIVFIENVSKKYARKNTRNYRKYFFILILINLMH
jgi:hypothetical protein